MKERPIIMTGHSVRAILDGRKTMTRRLVGLGTLQPSETPGYDWIFRGRAPVRSLAGQRRHMGGCWQDLTAVRFLALCPHGVPGDRLWVRETWRYEGHGAGPGVIYTADLDEYDRREKGPWKSPLFMKRDDSRLTLEVTAVRCERLQDITEADILAEGCTVDAVAKETGTRWSDMPTMHHAFAAAWDHVNGKRAPWRSSPWVWVISFRPVTQVTRPRRGRLRVVEGRR